MSSSLASVETKNGEQSSDSEKIFRSKLPGISINPNNLPLHAYCFERASQYPDRTCLIEAKTGKTHTFAETHRICLKTAASLSNLGIRKGDVIMLLVPNCLEIVFAFMGASLIGAITTTANPLYTTAEIYKQMSATKPKLVITKSQYVENLPKSFDDFNVITIDVPLYESCIHFSELMTSNEEDAPLVTIEPDDPLAIIFSSGTTGLPKGVVFTHRSLTTNLAQLVDGENPNFYLKSDDVMLSVLLMFHIYSLYMLLCSLRSGASVLVMEVFELKEMLELIQRYRVSVAPLVPTLVLPMVKDPVVDSYDLTSVRLVMSGAAPLGKELEEALLSRVVPQAVFGQIYGMTEAGPMISISPAFAMKPYSTKSGSCGTLVRNTQLKVIHLETGSSLERDQLGEICIRGPQLMKGYWRDAEATARIIDMDGWLHTGDIGYVDEDDEVFVVNRVKEIIKFKGFQVPPAELEALLLTNPKIVDAAVVGQKDDNDAAGEVPVAFVVIKSDGSDLTEEAIKDYVAEQVIFYKRLHKVYFVDIIPKTVTGKILRKDLEAKLASESSTC